MSHMKTIVTLSLIVSAQTLSTAESKTAAPRKSASPATIARSYFEAMDRSDIDAAGALFSTESSIFESGGVEGNWAHYQEHHLGPELRSVASFKTTLGTPESIDSADGTLVVVTWPIEYTIHLKDERLIQSRGTVTFVLERTKLGYRIRHLHWSSRRIKG